MYISAISAWEIATLLRKERMRIAMSVEAFITRLFTIPGAREVAVTYEIARMAGQLSSELHGDPADRIIIATAVVLGFPLVTRDRNILEFAKKHGGFSCIEA